MRAIERVREAGSGGGDLPSTWLVVPCYNEGRRLPVEGFLAFLDRQPALRVCLVNDGSTDDTVRRLESVVARFPERTELVDYKENAGKAEAVRRGVLRVLSLAPADFVGYWDADLAAPLEELPRFYRVLRESPRAEVLTGCRLRRMGARIERRLGRHLLGRIFATLASLLLNLPYYDTQCGAKVFRTDLARAVFEAPFLTTWCFDVEIIARICALRGRSAAREIIVEAPLLSWSDQQGSRLTLAGMARALWELGIVFRRYRVSKRAAG